MSYYTDFVNNYPFDPIRYLNFEGHFSDIDIDLFVGINYATIARPFSCKNKSVYMDFEFPNKLLSDVALQHMECNENRFNKIFSICPYTTNWRNEQLGYTKYHLLPLLLSTKVLPGDIAKKYDICYTGHYHPYPRLRNIVGSITRYNYRIVSGSQDLIITNRNESFQGKLIITASCKIALVHNLLFPSEAFLTNLKNLPGYEDNESFKHISSKLLCPQIKYRTFEAAFCKTLILCVRDPWNVIEHFFKENEHFIYCDENNINSKIEEILSNYDSYAHIIENAYRHAVNNYSSEVFKENIKGCFDNE